MVEVEEAAGQEPIIIDEQFMGQWVNWGLNDVGTYLANQAAFEAWCIDHERSLDG